MLALSSLPPPSGSHFSCSYDIVKQPSYNSGSLVGTGITPTPGATVTEDPLGQRGTGKGSRVPQHSQSTTLHQGGITFQKPNAKKLNLPTQKKQSRVSSMNRGHHSQILQLGPLIGTKPYSVDTDSEDVCEKFQRMR